MKLALSIVGLAVFLTGCAASKEYVLYAETQKAIAQANAQAHAMTESARYAALAEIAKNGDATARVAAAMSLSLGSGGGQQGNRQPAMPNVNPPKSFGDTALQWTSVLLPSLTQFYGINANRQIAITQSNNQAAVATSTNNTFATMSNNMAKSNTDIANAGFTAATAISNSGLTATTSVANSGLTATQNVATAGITGVVTSGANGLTATQNVATAGITGVVTSGANGLTALTAVNASSNTAITNVSNAANTSIQTLANQIPNLQPNVTNTTTTTNNNLTCPVGQTLVAGSCQ